MIRVAAACVAGVMVVGMLTGCGSISDAEAARNTAPATEEAEPEETPTASGIEFVNVPVSLSGAPAEVYSAIAIYERAVWRTSTEQEAGLTYYTAGAPLVEVGAAAPSTGQGTGVVGGGIQVSISDIEVDGATATGLICRDLSQMTVDGEADPAGAPQQVEASLSLDGETWQVDAVELIGTC